ncbi:MAG: hypothetical protein AAF227_12380, partial [Pseudomonadota bacterium]
DLKNPNKVLTVESNGATQGQVVSTLQKIDGRLKGFALSRLEATVIGAHKLVANDNKAPVALAA